MPDFWDNPSFGDRHYYDPDKKTSNPVGYILAGVGAAGTIGFAIPLIIKLGQGDGEHTSHVLTDADARLYAGRYNRAFLRKTVKDLRQPESDTARVKIFPTLGMGALQLTGTF
jgi:hypothetical protein